MTHITVRVLGCAFLTPDVNGNITRGRVFLPASYKIVVMLRDFLCESARLGNHSPSLADS